MTASLALISPESAYEKRELARIVGRRLGEARRLCNLPMAGAAQLLGYCNGSKLSKIENASDPKAVSVPMVLIRRASRLYDVSIDYLYGETDDFERDVNARDVNATARWLLEQNQRHIARELAAIRKLAEKHSALEDAVCGLSGEAETLLDAFLRFWELNPKLDRMPGGAPVVASLERMESASRKAKAALNRIRREAPGHV
jgi:hypothetical protein